MRRARAVRGEQLADIEYTRQEVEPFGELFRSAQPVPPLSPIIPPADLPLPAAGVGKVSTSPI